MSHELPNPERREGNMPSVAFGVYLPEAVLENDAVEAWNVTDSKGNPITSDGILKRTGIERRYVANIVESTPVMGRLAASRALAGKKEVDVVLFSSSYPVGFNQADRVIQDLGIVADGSMEIGAACSGFTRGLSFMKEQEHLFRDKDVLFIASEKYSNACADLRTPKGIEDSSQAQLLFSDGAVAMNFINNKDMEILSYKNFSLPSEDIRMPIDENKMQANYLREVVPHSPDFFRQNGTSVLKTVAKVIPSLVDEVVESANLNPEDIKFVIPHQPSRHVLHALSDRSPRYTYISDFQDGNFSSASIPLALKKTIEGNSHTALKEGHEMVGNFKLQKGDAVVLAGFGAGFFASLVVAQFH
jgi:3-oxoacyl-[acyl-carrier-protein] synthase-3